MNQFLTYFSCEKRGFKTIIFWDYSLDSHYPTWETLAQTREVGIQEGKAQTQYHHQQ